MAENHIIWHDPLVSRQDRSRLNGHNSGLIWFTGFPASGKSTIAHRLEKELFDRGIRSYVLDGDNVRHGINANLGFSREDRKENLRRIAELAKLMLDAGVLVLAAFVSPYREDRDFVRNKLGDDFVEIYVKCSLEVCEKRDHKGNYRKAKQGLIRDYTGVTAPYEEPESPDLVLDTEELDAESAVKIILEFLERKEFLGC